MINFDHADDGMFVNDGICKELDEMKQIYLQLPDFLTKIVDQELKRIPRALGRHLGKQLWSIVYMPQVCKASVGSNVRYILHDSFSLI